jgi:hypothetical protein
VQVASDKQSTIVLLSLRQTLSDSRSQHCISQWPRSPSTTRAPADKRAAVGLDKQSATAQSTTRRPVVAVSAALAATATLFARRLRWRRPRRQRRCPCGADPARERATVGHEIVREGSVLRAEADRGGGASDRGMPMLRHMLETMSWKYVFFYVRLKVQVPRPHHRHGRRPEGLRALRLRPRRQRTRRQNAEVRAFAHLIPASSIPYRGGLMVSFKETTGAV